jgi:CRP-like cAMP-binding protein
MMMDQVPAGSVIIKQGETGDYFYVVEEGQVSFAVDNQHVGSTGRGGSFGELALLCKFGVYYSVAKWDSMIELGNAIVSP